MNSYYQSYPRNNNRNQRGIIPLVVGGVIGYGIGVNSNRPNFYQPPFWGPMPFYPWSQPIIVYPPMYRR